MVDEKIKLRTEVDTDEASIAFEGLKSDLRDVKRELKEMGQVSEDWSEEQKQAYAELRERQRQLNEEIREHTRNLNVNEASTNELRAALRLLVAEQGQLVAGSEEWIEKTKEVNRVKERLEEVREEANQLGRALDDQKGIFDRWNDSALGTFAALQFDDLVDGVKDFARESIQAAAQQSDAFADVQKSTGMALEEIEALNKELSNIDTRSTQEALLDIAKVGGQLGIAKEEIKGFVESVDKANVALGDEFSGGAEEVASTMGTLAKLFRETKDLEAGKAINDIGSAINELGAAGSATGPVVAEFTSRMGQLGDLSPQISETMGLGAAIQELGMSAEIGAGGLKNILTGAAVATEEFANHLGITEVEMKKLINTNPNEFLLKMAESFKGMVPDEIYKRLVDLGIRSQEAQGVMSLLASKTDLVRDRQLLAAKAMKEGTSLTKEFEVKNQTAAAQLEKFNKVIEVFRVEIGTRLLPVLINIGNAALSFGKTLAGLPAFVNQNRTAIALLAVGILTLNANLIQAQVATLAKAAADRSAAIAAKLAEVANRSATTSVQTMTLSQRLAAVQTNLTAAATSAWTIIQNGLNTALRANPIGLVVTAIALLAAGIVTAYQKSETFRGVVNGVWSMLKTFGTVLGEVYDWVAAKVTPSIQEMADKLSFVKIGFSYLSEAVQTVINWYAKFYTSIYEHVIEPLGRLVGGVDGVKKVFGELWTQIAGFAQKVGEIGTSINNFLNGLGVVQWAKQKGAEMGKSFTDTYNAELAKGRQQESADTDKHNTDQGNKNKGAANAQANDRKQINTSTLDHISNEEQKHRDSEAKKAADHAKKVAEERRKANAEAATDIARRNIELIQDDQQRKLAQLAFERDQERARIEESKADQKLKRDQLALLEKSYQAEVAATQKDFRDKKKQAETEAMQKYLQEKEQQASKERSLFDELASYEKATRATNNEVDLSLTKLTENQKYDARKQQMADALAEQKASIIKEYTAKVTEITNNISDNDKRMQAIKTLNDWKNSQLNAADTKHAQSMTQLNQEHLATREQNTKEFFGAVDGLMKGDYTSFMNLLEKKLANEQAKNQKGLQDFAKTASSTLNVASQVVGSMQQLNQKYLEHKLNLLAKEKSKQLADWDEQYKKGKINKEQYEKGVEKINKEYAEKEKAEKLKAWKRDQAMQIAMALINTAQAVIKSLAMLGWPLGLIGAAVSGVMGGIQIAMIKSQQPPSFEKGAMLTNGGVPEGPRHGSKYGESGISLTRRDTGEEIGEMEGGEPIMILSRNTYKNNRPVIDQLLHSSLHKNGAPIFKKGGIMGSDGGSYRDYLKPLSKGRMYEDGTEFASGGDDFGTGSPDEASSTTAEAEAQIDQSMELMKGIEKNTLATSEQVKELMVFLNGNFLTALSNQAYYTRYQIMNTGYALENSQNREATRIIGEISKQGNSTRSLLTQLMNQTRNELLAELRRLTDSGRSQNNIVVNELQRQGSQNRLNSLLHHTSMLNEVQKQSASTRALDERQHQSLVQTLMLMYAAASTAAGSRHTATTNQLTKLYQQMSEADQARYQAFMKEIKGQLSNLNSNQATELRAMASEMKRQASALISETKSQTNALVGADNANTDRLKGDLGWHSYLLKVIADKQWSVSVHNVVQVWNQVNVINKDSNLR